MDNTNNYWALVLDLDELGEVWVIKVSSSALWNMRVMQVVTVAPALDREKL